MLSRNRPSAETRNEQTKLSFLSERTQLLGSIPLPIREGRCVGVCVTQSCPCPTLCDPMGCSPPGSSVPSRQEYWSGLPFPSPEVLPDPGIELGSPALQQHFLLTELPGNNPSHQGRMAQISISKT